MGRDAMRTFVLITIAAVLFALAAIFPALGARLIPAGLFFWAFAVWLNTVDTL